MSDIELWSTEAPVECRGGQRTIGGLALRFGSRSRDLGGFTETIAPSFVDRTRAKNFDGVICRYNHDSRLLLGTVDNQTLRCAVDDSGLDYSVDLPEWPGPPYIWEMVQRGDVRHSSFTMNVDPDGGDTWTYTNGAPLRTLVSGLITEVAPCPQPAYPDATCALRSLARTMSAPYDEVVELAEQRSLSKFFTRSDRPAPAKTMSGKDALVATLAQEYPEVGLVDAERRNRSGKLGADALKETLAAKPIDPKARLLETMAQRWPEFLTDAIDRSAGTPSVEDELAAARMDLRHTRNEIARLSDPVSIEREANGRAMELADQRARDELDKVSGRLSGAAALRLTQDARPDGCSPYVPRTETVPEEIEAPATEPEPEPAAPPQYRTLSGREALLMTMAAYQPEYVEPPRNLGRACDAYSAAQGGRF
jgi:uncharacterized protein